MITSIDSYEQSLGLEPKEVLGFSTDEELEEALAPLMQDVLRLAEFA